LAALEAMAAGVPVVSTNAGGLPEIIVQGYNGFMGNVGDVDTMSRQAIDILQNEDRLQLFKNNAAQHAKEFDIQNIIPLYEKLYEEVLSQVLVP
jgi:glycosyltransferase involved in cell wall biosynthesis